MTGDSVTAIPVRFAPLIAGNAPVKLAAVRFVIFDPLIAAAVPVKFAAGILVKLAPLPLNVVAVKVPFAELNVRLVPDYGARSPVAAVENKTLHEVSLDSSATVI